MDHLEDPLQGFLLSSGANPNCVSVKDYNKVLEQSGSPQPFLKKEALLGLPDDNENMYGLGEDLSDS